MPKFNSTLIVSAVRMGDQRVIDEGVRQLLTQKLNARLDAEKRVIAEALVKEHCGNPDTDPTDVKEALKPWSDRGGYGYCPKCKEHAWLIENPKTGGDICKICFKRLFGKEYVIDPSGAALDESVMPAKEVQRVYDETGDIGETELLCGVRQLKVDSTGNVVAFVTEDIKRIVVQPTLEPFRNRRAKASRYLASLPTYHAQIPLDSIFAKLRELGLDPVQEDGTAWSGFLTGRDGNARIELIDKATGRSAPSMLILNWHKMDVSGKYEIVAYLS